MGMWSLWLFSTSWMGENVYGVGELFLKWEMPEQQFFKKFVKTFCRAMLMLHLVRKHFICILMEFKQDHYQMVFL
jgi:hypothetical protein